MASWKKICCPVDFSWESRLAMQEAAELAWRFGSRLTLVHVQAPQGGAAPAPPVAEPARAELERKLAGWVDEAERLADDGVDSAVIAGTPADEIVRFARDGRYDVIVMGTRGDAAPGDWKLGSTAQRVVGTAPCTVVIARGRGYGGSAER